MQKVKTTFTILCSIAVSYSLCITTFAESQATSETPKTKVVIIGGIHDFHYKSPEYTPEVLKEIILALKPDAILNELPLSLVDPNGRPLPRHYVQSPECWAADTVATQLGIKQIPFDRPNRQEHYKKTKKFERRKKAEKRFSEWSEQVKINAPESVDLKITQLSTYCLQAQIYLSNNVRPEIINSDGYDEIIRIKHILWKEIRPEILKKYPGYETLVKDYDFDYQEWQERNGIMADNIIEAAKQYPGKRLVVVTGAEHRYTLRDFLKNEESIDLKEYWELIDFDLEKCLKSIEPLPQAGIVAVGLTKEEASQKVAMEYWQALIKGDWELANRLYPMVGVSWKNKYSKNMPVELIDVKEAYWPKGGGSSGPLAPCIVKFADARVLEIKMVSQFREIRGKTLCFIVATWGTACEIKTPSRVKEEKR